MCDVRGIKRFCKCNKLSRLCSKRKLKSENQMHKLKKRKRRVPFAFRMQAQNCMKIYEDKRD